MNHAPLLIIIGSLLFFIVGMLMGYGLHKPETIYATPNVTIKIQEEGETRTINPVVTKDRAWSMANVFDKGERVSITIEAK